MRPLTAMLSLPMAMFAGAAHADVTAHYSAWGPIGPSITFEVADNGDARVRGGDQTVAVRRNGITYFVRNDARGTFVLRASEFRRIDAQIARLDISDVPPAQVVERGTEIIAGRQGIILDVMEAADQLPGNPDWGYVVSRDPDLLVIGPIVAEMFGGSFAGLPPRLAAALRDLQARGTLVRLGPLIRLVSVDRAPISSEAFILPGPELSGEQARARLGRAW